MKYFISILAIVFGMITIKAGGSVLFSEAARDQAGNIIPFILWFNFIAGFFYILTGAGVMFYRRIAIYLAIAITVSSALFFIGLLITIQFGQPYEIRTVYAMLFRLSLWAILTVFILRLYHSKKPLEPHDQH